MGGLKSERQKQQTRNVLFEGCLQIKSRSPAGNRFLIFKDVKS